MMKIKVCRHCGAISKKVEQDICSACGADFCANAAEAEARVYSMRWFYFLIYFALFAAALSNLVSGIFYINGMLYFYPSGGEITAQEVYRVYGSSLRTLDIVFGIWQILLAVFAVVVRFRLARYKSGAPALFLTFLVVNMGWGLIYRFIRFDLIGVSPFDSQLAGTLLLGILYVVLHYRYFSARAELFDN